MTDEERAADSTTVFGFFAYLMTDFVLFATLFAVYAVLRANTFGGPTGADILNLPFAFGETCLLLASSFTCGLALLAARRGSKGGVYTGLATTFVLGAAFVAMEAFDFAGLVSSGATPGRSAFLSSYFTLVGTHGLHVGIGLCWILALGFAIVRRGLTRSNMRKLALFSLFWHFLEIIWIFIFTIVYLMGSSML